MGLSGRQQLLMKVGCRLSLLWWQGLRPPVPHVLLAWRPQGHSTHSQPPLLCLGRVDSIELFLPVLDENAPSSQRFLHESWCRSVSPWSSEGLSAPPGPSCPWGFSSTGGRGQGLPRHRTCTTERLQMEQVLPCPPGAWAPVFALPW